MLSDQTTNKHLRLSSFKQHDNPSTSPLSDTVVTSTINLHVYVTKLCIKLNICFLAIIAGILVGSCQDLQQSFSGCLLHRSWIFQYHISTFLISSIISRTFLLRSRLYFIKNSHPNFREHWSHHTEHSFTTQTVTTLI